MADAVQRHGLTVLYTPGGGAQSVVDIVLVHGLFGHPFKTWACETSDRPSSTLQSIVSKVLWRKSSPIGNPSATAVESEQSSSTVATQESSGQGPRTSYGFWPRDFLPSNFTEARIMTFGYDVDITHFFNSSSGASVYQHARSLLGDLADRRSGQNVDGRPLIFIAHSLGGIVVKNALVQSLTEKTHLKNILNATKGVCFLGTPHRGSGAASLGKIAFELSKITFRGPNTQVLRTLEVNSSELEQIGKVFGQILAERQLFVHSFHEELPTKGIMVVQNFSYSIGDAFETTSGIPKSHTDMTKFATESDVGYLRVCGVLQRWLRTGGISEPSLLCLNSLDIAETRDRLEAVTKNFGDTYSWIFSDRVSFKSWLSDRSANDAYWVTGKPGSGKSTLMKFAYQHDETSKCLAECDSAQWTCAGFFFHDRGSPIQKSIEGLLCAILHTILNSNRELIRFALPSYRKTVYGTTASADTSGLKWSADGLKEALIAILTQREVRFNVCLFIDALDEHSGDHKVLLHILQELNVPQEEQIVRLKLCLASRPENAFVNRLGTCPGFAIHEYTLEDIKMYTASRLKEVPGPVWDSASSNEFHQFTVEVADKAEGVFLWVRLVVDEFAEALEDGDSIDDLRQLLSVIPSELEDLYRRILDRASRRTSRIAQDKLNLESSVMFQIALVTRSPLPLPLFLNAVSLITANTSSALRLDQRRKPITTSDMYLRLWSRSSGLLEAVTGIEFHRTGERDTVQFIHQTAKEFIARETVPPKSELRFPNIAIEDGHLLMVRYYIRSICHDLDIRMPDMMFHARIAEKSSPTAVSREFDQLTKQTDRASAIDGRALPSAELVNLCFLLDFDKSFGRLRISTTDSRIWLLLIAIYGNLPRVLSESLNARALSELDRGRLLAGAAWATMSQNERRYLDPEVMRILIRGGISPEQKFDERSALQVIFSQLYFERDRLSRDDHSRGSFYEVVDLLLQSGADPDQIIGHNVHEGVLRAVDMNPLQVSLCIRDSRLAQILLVHGASVKTEYKNLSLIEFVIKEYYAAGDSGPVLARPVLAPSVSLVNVLLQHGATLPVNPDGSKYLPREFWSMGIQGYSGPE